MVKFKKRIGPKRRCLGPQKELSHGLAPEYHTTLVLSIQFIRQVLCPESVRICGKDLAIQRASSVPVVPAGTYSPAAFSGNRDDSGVPAGVHKPEPCKGKFSLTFCQWSSLP